MKRLLLFLVAFLLPALAHAAPISTYPLVAAAPPDRVIATQGATGLTVQESIQSVMNLGMPVVLNNAALQAKASNNGQWFTRESFSVLGDTYPLVYRTTAAACSPASDNGARVDLSDGGCAYAMFPPTGAPLSEWIGAGSTDNTTAVQAACNSLNGTGIPLFVDEIGVAIGAPGGTPGTGVVCPSGTSVFGAAWQGSSPQAPVTATGFQCANGAAYICWQANGLSGAALVAVDYHDLVFTGSVTTPTAGLVLFDVHNGYSHVLTNMKFSGGDTCLEFDSTAGGQGIHAKLYNVNTGACATTHVKLDGWPELYWSGGRLGDRSNNLNATSIFLLTNTGGVGPNTVKLDQLQINPSGGITVQCIINYAGFPASPPAGLTEVAMTQSHIEYTAVAANAGVFCTDPTVINIFDIDFHDNKITSGGGAVLPLFNLDPSTYCEHIWVHDNEFNGGLATNPEITLACPIVRDVKITSNRIDGGVSYNSNFSQYTGTVANTNTLTVSAITSGAGPRLYAQVQGLGITGGVWIKANAAYDAAHSTTSCSNGTLACTGVDGSTGAGTFAIGVRPGSSGTFGNAGPGAVTQSAGNELYSAGNLVSGIFTMSGLWDGALPATGSGNLCIGAFYTADMVQIGYNDTARGCVAAVMPPQLWGSRAAINAGLTNYTPPNLALCASLGCGTAANGTGSQTTTGSTWQRTPSGGFRLFYNIVLPGTALSAANGVEIDSVPPQLVCQSSTLALQTPGAMGSYALTGLTGYPFAVPTVVGGVTSPNPIELLQAGAAAPTQLVKANLPTSSSVTGYAECPVAY